MSSPAPADAAPALVRLFDEAQAWRARAAAAIDADLDALVADERVASRLLAEALRRHAAIAALRREGEQRVALLDDALLGRKRAAVTSALGIDRRRPVERAVRLAAEVSRWPTVDAPALAVGVLVSAEPPVGTPVSEAARDQLLEAIATAVDGADELAAAGVEVCAMFVTPDLIAGVAS